MGEPLCVAYVGGEQRPEWLAEQDKLSVTVAADTADIFSRVDNRQFHCVVAAADFEVVLSGVRERYPALPVLLLLAEDERPPVELSRYDPVDTIRPTHDDPVHRVQLHASQYREKQRTLPNRDRIRAFVETMPVGILVADSELFISRSNDRFQELFAEFGQSWEGRQLSELFEALTQASTTPDEEIRTLFAEHGDTSETLSEDLWIETDSGRSCYEITVTHREQTGGSLVLVRDITSTKRREETLRERENELEQRTEQLETQTAKLEYQNDRLDKFAGIVSHDLRNPLNVASGRLELLAATVEQADDPAVDPKNIEQIRTAHERMGHIISEALTLAREGKAITDTERTHLTETATRAWSTVATGEASLELCDPVEIESDPDRLQTVSENLFRNAVEHGPTDDATQLKIRVGLLDGGFYVEDTGPGIPDEDRGQIFEEGFTTNSEGTGFGLAIVRDVVRAHGWEITATEASTDAGGARFEVTGVTFPLAREDLISRLAEPLGHKKATELIDAALTECGTKQSRFDYETAEQILGTIADREDASGLVTVAAETARRKLE